MTRTCCHKHPKSWDRGLPSLLHAYNRTVHSSTGYTPHFLLFCWNPIDLRVPICIQTSSLHPGIDAYLSSRAATFQLACDALERAPKVLIAQRKASANGQGTSCRPLAGNKLSMGQATAWLGGQLSLGLIILLQLNDMTKLGVALLPLV
jgi:hypothetical protein